MKIRRLTKSVTSAVRSGSFQVIEESNTTSEGASLKSSDQGYRELAKGKVSIAYQGGGNWVVVCIDWESRRSSTSLIRVNRNGEIFTIDKVTNQEKLYGKLDLGVNGTPESHTEIDLLKHYSKLELLLADEIASQFSNRENSHTKKPSVSLSLPR
jgi:hypothetical protein